jgi:hypothetical protein
MGDPSAVRSPYHRRYHGHRGSQAVFSYVFFNGCSRVWRRRHGVGTRVIACSSLSSMDSNVDGLGWHRVAGWWMACIMMS